MASIAAATSLRTAFSSGCAARSARRRDNLHEFLVVALDHRGNERLLAREILVERADAHARLFGDTVGAGSIETSLTKMRAVASTRASTVARDRS